MSRRNGRGRLSSIELLPTEADPIVAWAMGELRERKRTQLDILAEFNVKLRALSAETGVALPEISQSAFNRSAVRLATTARRLEETREIAATLTERLQPGETDDLTILVGETIKTLVFEILETTVDADGRPTIDTTGAMELARALHAATSAQSVSSTRREKIEAAFAKQAAAALDKAGKAKGLTADTINDIKRQILGVNL